MKIVILAALTSLPFLSQAQEAVNLVALPDNGVYLTANDFTNRSLTDGFDTGQPGYRLHDETFRHAVKITQPSVKEVEIPTDNIWGERVKDVDYRRFNGELYRVEHADRVFIYSKISSFNQLSQSLYYFSREADSPIFAISSENLENVYYDQPDKKAFFDNMDDLSGKPVQQAIRLTHSFYTDGTHSPTASAD